jgi:alginate O-acetyltransferase complex protein AlgI
MFAVLVTMTLCGLWHGAQWFSTGGGFTEPLSAFWRLAAAVFAGHVLTRSGLWQELWFRAPAPVWGFGYAAALSLSLLLAPDAGKAFIYFQF